MPDRTSTLSPTDTSTVSFTPDRTGVVFFSGSEGCTGVSGVSGVSPDEPIFFQASELSGFSPVTHHLASYVLPL